MSSLNNQLLNSWILFPMIVWVGVWKGLALWYAARRGEKIWYVILMLVNTIGILEIIYIFAIAKRGKVSSSPMPQSMKN